MLLIPAIVAAHGNGEANILIQSVHSNSPAAAAGLEEGDSLLQLDDQRMNTLDDLRRVMAAHQPGDTVPLTVERKGKEVELTLTFGDRPGGGVSIGVSFAIMDASAAVAEGERLTRDECLAWVDTTYRLDSMMRDLELELSEDAAALRACLKKDIQRMPSPMPVGWCDNAFKIHCPGLDLLTEIGEAQIGQCGKLLGEPLDSCAAQKVFDRYARAGEASDETACRAAQQSCSGTK